MADKIINSDPLFDTAAAAEYGGWSIPTLERWRRNATGPRFAKMCGMVRYRKSWLDEFIEDCAVKRSRPPECARKVEVF
jgi:hypothetical protein